MSLQNFKRIYSVVFIHSICSNMLIAVLGNYHRDNNATSHKIYPFKCWRMVYRKQLEARSGVPLPLSDFPQDNPVGLPNAHLTISEDRRYHTSICLALLIGLKEKMLVLRT